MKCGRPKKLPPDSFFDPQQLAWGIKAELEHTCDREEAKVIAKTHLLENERYYTYHRGMERRMKRGLAPNPPLPVIQTGSTTTLSEVYGGEMPDREEVIWESVRPQDFTKQFPVVVLDPTIWCARSKVSADESVCDSFKNAEPWQRALVAKYTKQAARLSQTTFLIIDSSAGDLVDGNHRMVAYARVKIHAAVAVDIGGIA